MCRRRDAVGWCIRRTKNLRRVATRYDRPAVNQRSRFLRARRPGVAAEGTSDRRPLEHPLICVARRHGLDGARVRGVTLVPERRAADRALVYQAVSDNLVAEQPGCSGRAEDVERGGNLESGCTSAVLPDAAWGGQPKNAGVAQWQSPSLPSWPCGFDSHHPLQENNIRSRPDLGTDRRRGQWWEG